MLWYRCPGPASRGLEEFAQLWHDHREHHLLPADGTMMDQSHWFVSMLRAADAELGAVEREQREKRDREAVKERANRPPRRGR